MIPSGLKDRDKWICWQYEDRDGKEAKIPVSPLNADSGRINIKDPRHWSDVETAQATVEATDRIAGIGWVLHTDGPLVGIDLDNCREPATGTIQDWAMEIVDTIDSYTEVSPSGTGLHILVEATDGLPGNRNRSGDIEIYEGKRFFTVTGEPVSGYSVSISNAQSELNEIYGEYLSEESEGSETKSSTRCENNSGEATPLEDNELIQKAKNAKNGETFKRLWQGDTSGYPSHSEARLALYDYLAFWTGKDKQQMWQLFKQSGLYPHPEHNGKCERLKDREIDEAIRGTRNTYTGTTDTDKIPTDNKEIASDGGRLTVSDPTVRGVIEALEELGKASTAEITNHHNVDRSKRQVQRAINYLEEHGTVEWFNDGRSTAYRLLD